MEINQKETKTIGQEAYYNRGSLIPKKAPSIVGTSSRNRNREPDDFYPTPPFVVEELLKRENFVGEIWEPACGDGAISDVLIDKGYDVLSSDLINRGYGIQLDFLKPNSIMATNIITNPPFKYGLEFVLESKKRSDKKIAMIFPFSFYSSKKRYEMFEDKEFPLKTVYSFKSRISMYKPDVDTKNKGKITFAWFVWEKGYKGDTMLKMINR